MGWSWTTEAEKIEDMNIFNEVDLLKVGNSDITAEENCEWRENRRISPSPKNGQLSHSNSNGGTVGDDSNNVNDCYESDEVYNDNSEGRSDADHD